MHPIFYVIAVIAVLILCVSEHKSHDCASPHKHCTHNAPSPVSTDDNITYIDMVINMVRNNYSFVMWRQAFIVAIIAGFPIIYYLKGRLPEFFEWVVIGVIIFIFTYLSSSWILVHFYLPNGKQMENTLIELRDRIQDGEGQPTPNSSSASKNFVPWDTLYPTKSGIFSPRDLNKK